MTTQYEPDEVESSIAGWTGVLLAVFIVLAALMALWFYRKHEGGIRQVAAFTEPPQPRLLVNEVVGRKAYLSDQQTRLGTYEWVDRAQGIVRVPIDRAMELLLSQSGSAAAPAPERHGQ